MVKVVGVCDVDASRRDGAAKRTTGAEAFASHTAMLEKLKELGAVIIATPTHLHRQIAIDCVKAGKHVYCEAPLAHTVEDCRAIAAAVAGASGGSKRVFAVGFEGRSNPIYKLARTFFRSDAVRDFVEAEAQCFKKESWRFPAPAGADESRAKAENWRLDAEVSTGLAGEWGAQQFDVVHWYTGKWPTSIFGVGSVRGGDEGRTVADTAACNFGFEDGSRFAWNASLANSYGGKFEVLRGTNAAVKLAWTHGWMFKEADAPTQGWEVYANRQQFFNDEGITLIADATKLAAQGALKDGVGLPNKSLYYALEDFVKAVMEEKQPGCDVAAGARSSIVAILANQAVVKGEVVRVDAGMLKM
jgi:predicted dehydrogenase